MIKILLKDQHKNYFSSEPLLTRDEERVFSPGEMAYQKLLKPMHFSTETWGWILSFLFHALLLFGIGLSLFPKSSPQMPALPPSMIELVPSPEPQQPQSKTEPQPPPLRPDDMVKAVVQKPKALQKKPAPRPQQPSLAQRVTAMALPDYLRNPPPIYPEEARRKGEQGVVYIWVKISPAGTVASLSIYRSSGFADLDASAVDAVKRWRFHPAKSGNTPVESQAVVPVQFHLTK
ncbi:TonB family protein [Candidatus Methylacidiphilum infernorum]|uniref:Periplasmic protein TonB n=1 Tax=Methylacidiphilum infernorum (isolate V4) TaxID=481448 RepID=B3DZS1_METI4|nr:TonB family protein [Candidatus Methylacidiphilum infernorum]ACD84256.1 Periplasmic protein TonB [Methylacidiphilum infernorum V4]